MAGTIRMTPASMRARAGEYRTEASNIEQIIAKLDSLLGALQEEWEGASSESFAARYTELRPCFVNTKTLVEQIAQSLDNAAASLEETDQAIKF